MGNAIDLVTELPGPKSAAILARKAKVVCDPLDIHVPAVIDHGEGAMVTDIDGNTLIDFSAGPRVPARRLFAPQGRRGGPAAGGAGVAHRLLRHPLRGVRRARRAAGRAHRGSQGRKVALFNAGAEAIENAVKFARAATGRPAVLCFEGGFHGRTLLTMSLTSRAPPVQARLRSVRTGGLPAALRLPVPKPDPEDAGAGRAGGNRAGVHDGRRPLVASPAWWSSRSRARAGSSFPPPEFLQGAQATVRASTGSWWSPTRSRPGAAAPGRFLASEHFGFEPDIVVLAKALAAGYPLSAVVARAEIMDAPGPSAIGGTYVGNPVACAAAVAVLDVIEEEGLMERSDQVGKTVRARWEELGAAGRRGRRDPGPGRDGRGGVRPGPGDEGAERGLPRCVIVGGDAARADHACRAGSTTTCCGT